MRNSREDLSDKSAKRFTQTSGSGTWPLAVCNESTIQNRQSAIALQLVFLIRLCLFIPRGTTSALHRNWQALICGAIKFPSVGDASLKIVFLFFSVENATTVSGVLIDVLSVWDKGLSLAKQWTIAKAVCSIECEWNFSLSLRKTCAEFRQRCLSHKTITNSLDFKIIVD